MGHTDEMLSKLHKSATLDHLCLTKLIAAVRPNVVTDYRDAALVILLYETGLRPGDILRNSTDRQTLGRTSQVDDLWMRTDGTWCLKVYNPQTEPSTLKEVDLSEECALWLNAWIRLAGLTSGPLFRAAMPATNYFDEAPALEYSVARTHLKRFAERAGLGHLNLNFNSIRYGNRIRCEVAPLPLPPESISIDADRSVVASQLCTRRPSGYVGVARQDRARRKLMKLAHCVASMCPLLQKDPDDMADWLLYNYSPSSVKNVTSGTNKWLKWLADESVDWRSPASFIDTFVDHLVACNCTTKTQASDLWALGVLWEACGLSKHPARTRIRQIHRQLSRKIPRKQVGASPLLRTDLDKLLYAVRHDCAEEVGIGTLCIVMHETLARTRDILGYKHDNEWVLRPVEISDLQRMRDGSGRLQLASDGSACGVLPVVTLSSWAMQWIDDWLSIAGLTSGPLFRATPRDDGSFHDSSPLQERTATKYFYRLVTRAGLLDRGFTLRSLRVGTANDLILAGMHPESVRIAGRWNHLPSVAFQEMKHTPERPAEELAKHFGRVKRHHLLGRDNEVHGQEVQLTFIF